jgi:hypothetical protein
MVEGSKEAEQVDGSDARDDDAGAPQRVPQNPRGAVASVAEVPLEERADVA